MSSEHPRSNRLVRLLKHRWHDDTDTARALDGAALQRLQAQVSASEQHHSGEIRLCVEAGLPLSYVWRHATPRKRAVTVFGKLRVWDTEDNNGVLIYLLLAERAIEVVADRGLARRVPQPQWDTLLSDMRQAFANRQFESGLAQAITVVDKLLRQHFALAPGQTNPNELPDGVELR